jgi:UDP-N-acetylglucosamine acyltransferase
MTISPLAVVHPEADIGQDVIVEPFVTIEKGVVIGDRCHIKSHAIIMAGTSMGRDCRIFPGAIVGGDPQDLKYQGEKTSLIIHDHVTIREYCTINRGTIAAGKTEIREHALIMAYTHVAHDCVVGAYSVLANGVNLAGHVVIGDYAIIGGMTAVQQFVSIGESCFVGGGTLVRKDVPPYIKSAREPLAYMGVNTVGLKRRGFTLVQINHIKDIYRSIFVKHKNVSIGMEEVEAMIMESSEKEKIMSFIQNSGQGMLRGFKQIRGNDY